MSQNFKKDYFWNTFGVLLQNAISPLLLVVVTRTNGIEAAGVFSFAFAVSLLLWALAMWGGRTYQVSDTQTEFEHRSYIMVRLLLAAAVLLVAVVFCLLNGYDAFKFGLIISLTVFKLLESFADVLYGILQVHGKLYVSGKSLALKAIAGLIVFTTIDITTGNLLLAVMGIIIVNALVLAAYDFRYARKLESIIPPLQGCRRYILEAVKIIQRCAGVFMVFFVLMFSLNIPRYFIDVFHPEENGFFGIISMPITLIALLVSFILQPNIVGLSKMYNNGEERRFRKTTNKLVLLSAVVGIAVLLLAAIAGVWMLRLVFGVDFSHYQEALVVIVAGGVASAMVTVYLNIFVIMRRIKFLLISLVGTSLVLLPLAYIMVLHWGLIGGVWSFLIVSLLQLLIVAVNFRVRRSVA